MSKNSIEVNGIGKLYRLGESQGYQMLRDLLVRAIKTPFRMLNHKAQHPNLEKDYIWALRDVSFEVKPGEVVGIIGKNGAGKSTLLKILSRITQPSEGYAAVCGRVASLLEVGTGFHPELSGRDNIFFNGALLGMETKEIKKRFDDIISFAEVEKFIDTPLKHYSSGMYVRLAFAVAAYLETDILIVDEVLAVGDVAFQKKCLGKIERVSKEGKAVLFASHNMTAINDLCSKCIWLDEGRLREQGVPQQVVCSYLDASQKRRGESTLTHIRAYPHSLKGLVFIKIMLVDRANDPITSLHFQEKIRIVMEYEVSQPLEGIQIMMCIEKYGMGIISICNHIDQECAAPLKLLPGIYTTRVELDMLLMPGNYSVGVAAIPVPGYWGVETAWDYIESAILFNVKNVSVDQRAVVSVGGFVRPRAQWTLPPSA